MGGTLALSETHTDPCTLLFRLHYWKTSLPRGGASCNDSRSSAAGLVLRDLESESDCLYITVGSYYIYADV